MRFRDQLGSAILPLASLAGLGILWQAGYLILGLPAFILPSPGSVLETSLTQRQLLMDNAAATMLEALIGFALAVVAGVAIGIGVAESGTFARHAYPLVLATQSVPKLALAPLFTLWFGFGLTPKVLIAFLIAFFPIVIGTVVGLQSVRSDTVLLGKSMGMGRLRILLAIKAPAAGPSVFGGLKIGTTFAIIGAVTGEFLGANAGLGRLTQVAAARLNTSLLFADLILLGILGVMSYSLVAGIERLLIPWRVRAEEHHLGVSM